MDSKKRVEKIMRSMDPRACPKCARRDALEPLNEPPREDTVLGRPGLEILHYCTHCGEEIHSMFVFAHHQESEVPNG